MLNVVVLSNVWNNMEYQYDTVNKKYHLVLTTEEMEIMQTVKMIPN